MKEGTRNFLVGLFVIASLSALGILMVAFGEAPSWLGGDEWTLRITGVEQLRGVGAGSAVNMNGVEIGRVKSLDFKDVSRPDLGVVIVTGIKKTYYVPSGAYAKVYGATLGFGSGRVDIVVDSEKAGEPLDRKTAVIRGEMHNIISEVISKELIDSVQVTIANFGKLAAAAEPLAKNLNQLLEQRTVAQVDHPDAGEQGLTANLSTAVERIDTLASNINEVLGDDTVQEDVKSMVRDLQEATSALKETIALWKSETARLSGNLDAGITRTRENLDRSFIKLTNVLDNLDNASGGLATLLQRINEGQGTVGLLARDPRLYEAGVLTLERLNELIATLQRIIGKAEEDGYIKIGKATAVGTLKADVPIGKVAAKLLAKLGGSDDGGPLIDPGTSPVEQTPAPVP